MEKKAILVVSFGTTYFKALAVSIASIEDQIKKEFPEYDVKRAFTSRKVIKILAERDGIQIDTEKMALERLQAEEYKEIIIQPLHVVMGEEYDKVKAIVSHYVHNQTGIFDKIFLGRPLLSYTGQAGKSDDYLIAIRAIQQQIPPIGSENAVVFMGHGGIHPANTAYAALQMKLEMAGLDRVFVYTVEGFPELDIVIAKLKKFNVKKVTLMPFMVTSGDHANNDMAGDNAFSAKSQLSKAGFEVEIYLHGLGENEAIQKIYVHHLQDAIKQAACYKVN